MSGRLDEIFTGADYALEDLEIRMHDVVKIEHTHHWNAYDLKRLRRITRRLDELGGRIEGKLRNS